MVEETTSAEIALKLHEEYCLRGCGARGIPPASKRVALRQKSGRWCHPASALPPAGLEVPPQKRRSVCEKEQARLETNVDRRCHGYKSLSLGLAVRDCAAQDTKRDASDATGHALRGRIQPEKCAIARLAGFFETGWVFVERSCNAGLARNELGPRIAGTASNPL